MQALATPDLYLIPLSQLRLSPSRNVRKVRSTTIEGLARNIAAKGLVHNLTGYPVEGGKSPVYEISAGGRRLQALQLLVKQKRIKPDAEIPVSVVTKEAAIGLSLTENVEREAMHPADEFEAYAALVEEGEDVDTIAATYNVTPEAVTRRLALARVSPKVIAKYRDGKLSLDVVQALTLTSDHALQESLTAKNANAWAIRRQLSEGSVSSTDRRAVYVTLAAYEAAGGHVSRDLFDDRGDGVYLGDAGLLERLALAKLEPKAEKLRREWAWVEVRTEFEHNERGTFGTVPTVKRELTGKAATAYAKLIAENERLSKELAALDEAGADEDTDAKWEELCEAQGDVEAKIEAIDSEREEPHAEAAALAGAVVFLDHAGRVKIETGLIHPKDRAQVAKIKTAIAAQGNADAGKSAGAADTDNGTKDPQAVRMELTALRTAIVQDAIATSVPTALRLLAYQLVNSLTHGAAQRGIHIRAEDRTGTATGIRPEWSEETSVKANAARCERWAALLPEVHADDGAALYAAILAMPDDQVLALLAHCTACAYDDTQRFPESRDEQGPALLAQLGIEVANEFRPTAEQYFSRIKKDATLAALAEAGVMTDAEKPALAKLKRAELAGEAEKRIHDTRWLPTCLRQA
jgi:ParB family chromosome partitioning protein